MKGFYAEVQGLHSPTRRGDSETEAEGHADRLTQGRTDGCLDGSRRGATFDGVGTL